MCTEQEGRKSASIRKAKRRRAGATSSPARSSALIVLPDRHWDNGTPGVMVLEQKCQPSTPSSSPQWAPSAIDPENTPSTSPSSSPQCAPEANGRVPNSWVNRDRDSGSNAIDTLSLIHISEPTRLL